MAGDGFLELNANPVVVKIGKRPEDFQRDDLVAFVASEGIKAIHFRYAGGDGGLKELKIPVNSRRDLELLLSVGERVDGSSLFKGLIPPESSDLYAVPVYRSAFLDPFTPDTLNLICRFFDRNGKIFSYGPAGVLARAAQRLREKTGADLNAMGELEFYLILDPEPDLCSGSEQAGYHASEPYTQAGAITDDILRLAAQITSGCVKYCHAEVGVIPRLESEVERLDGKRLEQHELEFLPAPVEEMADSLVTAQWLIRRVAARYGAGVTFAPKIEASAAGTGLHIHMEVMRDGRNVMHDAAGNLSDTARQAIAGLLTHAASLTAFGNTVTSSWLRLVPNQEAPTKICWSECNRSALVRVPLGWGNVPDMAAIANPKQADPYDPKETMQTVEFRAPDGSADIYMLLAGICVAVTDGLTAADSLEVAEKAHVSGDFLHDREVASRLDHLPQSCHASALALERDRAFYERDGVFPSETIDFALKRLRAAGDETLNADLQALDEKPRAVTARTIMHRLVQAL